MKVGEMFLFVSLVTAFCADGALAQQKLVVKQLAEKKIAELPAQTLYWRIENFATLAQAKAAAGPMGLAAESGGKVWLFTLGSRGGSTAGGTKVAEIGPIPRIIAPQYLLRINEASGPPGSVTPVHTHPGSEAFYVLAGEQTIPTAPSSGRCRRSNRAPMISSLSRLTSIILRWSLKRPWSGRSSSAGWNVISRRLANAIG
jgi:hypothetical protein